MQQDGPSVSTRFFFSRWKIEQIYSRERDILVVYTKVEEEIVKHMIQSKSRMDDFINSILDLWQYWIKSSVNKKIFPFL